MCVCVLELEISYQVYIISNDLKVLLASSIGKPVPGLKASVFNDIMIHNWFLEEKWNTHVL